LILSKKEVSKWREVVDKRLLKNAEDTIDFVTAKYPKTAQLWNKIRDNLFMSAQWDMSDYIVVTKMNYNAHGDIHAKVVASNALKMLDLLIDAGIQPDIVNAKKQTQPSGEVVESGDIDDAHLIVLLSGLLHDIGNQINREGHNLLSVVLAVPLLDDLLKSVYPDERKRGVIRAFILHSIYTHMEEIESYTIESSLVKVADGTDMSKGRGRTPYDLGNINIHTVSAMSIGSVDISKGDKKPIRINVKMTNSAGVFQVEEILYKKLAAGVLSNYVEVTAETMPEIPPKDERIVYKVTVEEGKFKHTRQHHST
jgi:metal-dependent HD superfamily phosphatase/phosphodiesterase